MTERHPTEIRPATADDAERIAALFTDEGYPAGPSDILERLGRFDSPHSRVLVADHDGEVLGFVAVHALPRFEHSDRIVRIMALVVEAGVRERGIGRLLMEAVRKAALAEGISRLSWGVHKKNADALRFYEALGAQYSHDTYFMYLDLQ